ncbi:MAG: oligoendopeptidase F, partial [Rhodospirillaceae bacterium]|nr:oligoendopeptidase F [Rhodospirillaceae bacterium]
MSVAVSTSFSALPEWDLSDLYPSPDSSELQHDLSTVENHAASFSEAFAGRLEEMDAAAFAKAMADYERINEILGRILSYAQLRHATAVTDPEIARFQQNISERATTISQKILFFTLEINRVSDARIESWLSDAKIARYAPWFRQIRAFRAHQLSDEAENLLHEREVVGRSAWTRLYDETLAEMRFPFGDQSLTMTEAFDKLSDPDRTVRAEAGRVIAKVLRDNARVLSLVTNVLAKDKQIDDDRRGYAHPVSPRNLANQVEDEVVDALVAAVKDAYPRLSHRYYSLKAKWLGQDTLTYADRNAPLPGDSGVRYSWAEAVKTVMTAYGDFSPAMADVAQSFFDRAWIDAPVRAGKASGAF